jgi:hypothetical protein
LNDEPDPSRRLLLVLLLWWPPPRWPPPWSRWPCSATSPTCTRRRSPAGEAGAKVTPAKPASAWAAWSRPDSFQRASGSMEARFEVTDGDAQLPWSTPASSRTCSARAGGGRHRRMQGGVFVAEEVLAKHDETYMPKEVADKMGMAHKKHDVPATAAEPADCGAAGLMGHRRCRMPAERALLPELGQVALILALLAACMQALLPLLGAQRGAGAAGWPSPAGGLCATGAGRAGLRAS